MPTLGPVFEPLPEDPGDREAVVDLREELQDQLDRGATHAFSPSFGLGALIGPAGPDPDRPGEEGGPVSDRADRGKLLVLGSIAVSLALVRRLPGRRRLRTTRRRRPRTPASRAPGATPKACRRSPSSSRSRRSTAPPASSASPARPWPGRWPREESRERFAKRYDIDDAELARAIRAGLLRAVDDAEEAGALSPFLAAPLRQAIAAIPLDQAIELVNDARSLFEGGGSIVGLGETGLGILEELPARIATS